MNQRLLSSYEEAPRIRVLFSTDIMLECVTNFNGYVNATEALLELVRFKKIKAYITDYCLQKIGFYLGKPDLKLGEEAVSQIRTLLEDRVIHINRGLIEDARKLSIKNFDASIEVACAMACGLQSIVTQDPQSFVDTTLPALEIEDFLKRQALEGSLIQNSLSLTVLMSNWSCLIEMDKLLASDSWFQVNLFGINDRNNLTTLKLQDSDLRKANLSSATLRGVDLRGANLQEAKLIFASLYCARLNGADLSYTDMRGVNFSLSTLSESDLSFSDLTSSNLSATDLSNALLYEANLQGTNLKDANLQGADLRGADLRGADLRGANLQDANVALCRFGQNIGITALTKMDLIHRGAVFLEERLERFCAPALPVFTKTVLPPSA